MTNKQIETIANKHMQDAIDELNDANRHLTRTQCEAYADEVCPKWRELL